MWFAKDKESDEIDYLAEVKEFHRQFVAPYKGSPKGCWGFEIRALEKSFGFELPLAYKQFLAWMGKDYNGVFVGCDWFLRHVEDNTALVPELLDENNIIFGLPEHYLCFSSHQGYIAMWFELPKVDDNPPCWYFHEGENEGKPEIIGRFTEILLEDMRGFAEPLARLYQRAT